jgi:hypothetical protein
MASRHRNIVALGIIAIASAVALIAPRAQTPEPGPVYTADGRLNFPATYRTWVFLSSGLDMSYLPFALPGRHSFTNVFVNPSAYESFQKTGTWPDKTTLILEVRRGETNGSINRNGQFQAEIVQTEVHLKDQTRGGWAFYGFRDQATPAAMTARTADCYSCHQANGAVDTTFVQFYPTLLPIAQEKKTLSAGYLTGEAKPSR